MGNSKGIPETKTTSHCQHYETRHYGSYLAKSKIRFYLIQIFDVWQKTWKTPQWVLLLFYLAGVSHFEIVLYDPFSWKLLPNSFWNGCSLDCSQLTSSRVIDLLPWFFWRGVSNCPLASFFCTVCRLLATLYEFAKQMAPIFKGRLENFWIWGPIVKSSTQLPWPRGGFVTFSTKFDRVLNFSSSSWLEVLHRGHIFSF